MRDRAFTVLVVLIILLAVSLYGTRAAADRTAGPADGILVLDANGRSIRVLPTEVARTGPEQQISAPGRWSFSDLGYGDFELSAGGPPAKLLSISYELPEDASQGPELWYLLHVRAHIEVALGPGDRRGSLEFYANGASVGSVILSGAYDPDAGLQTVTWGVQAVVDGQRQFSSGSSTESSLELEFSTYLPGVQRERNGVLPGLNSLAFGAFQRSSRVINGAIVLADSYLETTSVPPPEYKPLSLLLEGQPILPEPDFARAREIVLADPVVQELLAGKGFTFDFAAPWDVPQTETDREIRVDISLDRPYKIEYEWPWPPAPVRHTPAGVTTRWVEAMTVIISGLENGEVRGIMPERHPGVARLPYVPDSDIPRLTAEQKTRATELALAHPTVQRILSNRSHEVAAVGPSYNEGDKAVIGANVEIAFGSTQWIDEEWLVFDSGDTGSNYAYYSVSPRRAGYRVDGLWIYVDFAQDAATVIMPKVAAGG